MSNDQKKRLSDNHKGQIPWNKGIPCSDAHKKKQSDTMKGRKCGPPSEATKKKISDGMNKYYINHPEVRKLKMSKSIDQWSDPESRENIVDGINKYYIDNPEAKELARLKSIDRWSDPEFRENMLNSIRQYRIDHPEFREKLSAAQQGISYDEWEAFAQESLYCPKFNEACRESNRGKYGRRCFICGMSEKDNGQKLSVHHTDMDKAQGCESNWKLVPLCKHCHAKAHNDELIARLGYLIKEKS